MQNPDSQKVEELFAPIRNSSAAEALEYVRTKTDSTLAHLFLESVPELHKLNGRNLIERLRSNEFALDYVDMGIACNLAMYFVDIPIKELSHRKMYTKGMGMPRLLVYEHRAKIFGEEQEIMNEFFEEYERKKQSRLHIL